MIGIERRNLIINQLQEQGKVYVSELAKEFGVSEETIRRDLDKLAQDNIAKKSYGGAVLNETLTLDLPFNVRSKSNVTGKTAIAQIASSLIGDHEHIFLDASSTAIFIAKAIKEKRGLTIMTNSIENLIELADVDGWDVICSGGRLRPAYLALYGPKAVEGISAYNVEKAFISCKGLDMEHGVMEGNEEVAQAKITMIHHAREVYLTADSSKFGNIAFSSLCEYSHLTGIITDERPSDAWVTYLEERNVKLFYPEAVEAEQD